jgi:hypothetical protein
MNDRIVDAARKIIKLQELKLDNDVLFTEFLMNDAIHKLKQEIQDYDDMVSIERM